MGRSEPTLEVQHPTRDLVELVRASTDRVGWQDAVAGDVLRIAKVEAEIELREPVRHEIAPLHPGSTVYGVGRGIEVVTVDAGEEPCGKVIAEAIAPVH